MHVLPIVAIIIFPISVTKAPVYKHISSSNSITTNATTTSSIPDTI